MFNLKNGLAFSSRVDGGVIIVRNGGVIAVLTKDDWVSVITHMAGGKRALDETHDIAERLHAGDPILK